MEFVLIVDSERGYGEEQEVEYIGTLYIPCGHMPSSAIPRSRLIQDSICNDLLVQSLGSWLNLLQK